MIKPPWNAIRWGYKAVVNQIVKDYRACPNVVEIDNKLYCYTWYRHDDCVRIMNLLYKITNNSKYTLPEIKEEVKQAIDYMLTDPNTHEILKRLKD